MLEQIPHAPLAKKLRRGGMHVLPLGQGGGGGPALEHGNPQSGPAEQVGHGQTRRPATTDDDIGFGGDLGMLADDHFALSQPLMGIAMCHVRNLSLALRAMRAGLLFHSDHEPTNRRGVTPNADKVSTDKADSTPPPQ